MTETNAPDSQSSASASSSASGGCPVKHGQGGQSQQNQQAQSLWTSFFTRNNNNINPNPNINNNAQPSTSGCPVKGVGSNPASIEESAKHAQTPQPDQTIPLSTYRTTSSIPKPNDSSTSTKASVVVPAHQPHEANKWIYPSEQQFFNAMKKKGWGIPQGTELTIPQVVQIHNAVNERGWSEVLKWERIRTTIPNPNPNEPIAKNVGNDGGVGDGGEVQPRLVRFIGRPKDLSPRARLYSALWLRNEPFDRHDWFVDHGEGTGVRRYVIDFYNGKESSGAAGAGSAGNGLPSMYLDVRPALDDLDSAQDRFKMFWVDAFPGIAGWMGSSGWNNRSDGANSNR